MTYKGLIKKIKYKKFEGVSQKEMSKEMELIPSRLSQIIHGKVQPTKRELEKFAKFFGCDISELVEIED